MKKSTPLLLMAVILISACQKSPFPPFDDASNIVIDGKKLSAREYLEKYCIGKPGGSDDKYCKAAIEQNTKEFLKPSGNSQTKTKVTGEIK